MPDRRSSSKTKWVTSNHFFDDKNEAGKKKDFFPASGLGSFAVVEVHFKQVFHGHAGANSHHRSFCHAKSSSFFAEPIKGFSRHPCWLELRKADSDRFVKCLGFLERRKYDYANCVWWDAMPGVLLAVIEHEVMVLNGQDIPQWLLAFQSCDKLMFSQNRFLKNGFWFLALPAALAQIK